MDTNNSGADKKHLTTPVRIVLLLTALLLSLFYATGVFGAVGILFMLTAVAMNVLLALELDGSNARLFGLLLVGIFPFVAAAVYFNSALSALGALYVPMMAFGIWSAIRMGYGRSASIAIASIGTMLIWCTGLVAELISEQGVFNAEVLGALLDSMFDPYVRQVEDIMKADGKALSAYVTAADIDMLRYYFKTMFFGAVAMVMVVWAYLATLATRLIAKVFGISWRLPASYRVGFRAMLTKDGPKVEIMRERVTWRIQLDSVSAGVYIGAYILTVLLAPSSGMLLTLYTVAINLILILSPGFLYCGLRDIVLGFRKKSTTGPMSHIALILGLVMMFISPASVVFILSALGVIVTIRENRTLKNAQKTGKE